jgi:hypothetical protein
VRRKAIHHFFVLPNLEIRKQSTLLLGNSADGVFTEEKIWKYCKEPCLEACTRNFDDIVEYFLRQGFDVNTPIKKNRHLLYYVSTFGNLLTVRLLVEYGAKMENELHTGIVTASLRRGSDYKGIIRFLLNSACNVANGGLHACALWHVACTVTNLKIKGLLKAKGFRKTACQNDCWSEGKYLWSKRYHGYGFGDYIAKNTCTEKATTPRKRESKTS